MKAASQINRALEGVPIDKEGAKLCKILESKVKNGENGHLIDIQTQSQIVL